MLCCGHRCRGTRGLIRALGPPVSPAVSSGVPAHGARDCHSVFDHIDRGLDGIHIRVVTRGRLVQRSVRDWGGLIDVLEGCSRVHRINWRTQGVGDNEV